MKDELRTDYERFEESSVENRRLLREEELILEATEVLSIALAESGLNKTELADRLGKTRGFVTQVLAGGRNLTLRTVADVADALGYRVRMSKEPEQKAQAAFRTVCQRFDLTTPRWKAIATASSEEQTPFAVKNGGKVAA